MKLLKSSNNDGFSNRETWIVSLWIDNGGFYDDIYNYIKDEQPSLFEVVEYIRTVITDLVFDGNIDGLAFDLLNYSLSKVNWKELAENYIEDAEFEKQSLNNANHFLGKQTTKVFKAGDRVRLLYDPEKEKDKYRYRDRDKFDFFNSLKRK